MKKTYAKGNRLITQFLQRRYKLASRKIFTKKKIFTKEMKTKGQ